MSDKLEALRIEAETLSGLMMQLAENEIDSNSFAVMSDLGENGQEHDCDLPITETALRAAAVIDQLLAALKEAEQREDRYRQRWVDAVADLDVAGKRNADLEQRLQQPIPESLIDSVCHTAAEIFRARHEDKAQEIIDNIREMLTSAKGV